jgi:NIPSNAP
VILEIRTYRLHPGTREEFLRAMTEEAIPLLRKVGIDVVATGPSQYAEDGHEEAFLMRAFDSVEQLQEQEDAFYSSAAWLEGPREAIVTPIVQYHSIAMETSAAVVEGLRQAG